jgi:hypothetical protein
MNTERERTYFDKDTTMNPKHHLNNNRKRTQHTIRLISKKEDKQRGRETEKRKRKEGREKRTNR